MTVTNTLITSYKMPLLATTIRLLMRNIVADLGRKVKDYRTWLRVVDDVRTLVISSPEYILIPKLEQIPRNYV